MSHFEYRRIDCPTCAVDDTRRLGRRGGRAHRSGSGEECVVVQCRHCGLIYANPFPFPHDLDRLYSESHDYFGAHAGQAERTDERDPIIAGLERLTDGRKLLDVGAGRGETVAAALRRGWDAWGIEPSSGFVARAGALAPGRVLHGEIQRAPESITAQRYDAVVLGAVLEHLHDPASVLAAIAGLMKPGGVLYLDVPNETGLYFKLGNLWMRMRGRDWVVNLAPTFSPFHVFGFSRRSLTAMLNRHGLAPEIWRFYSGVTLVPLKRSLSGVVEWAGSRIISRLADRDELSTYLECIARRM